MGASLHRANLTYSDEEWKAMVKYCKKVRPYQPVTTTIKEMSLLNCTSKCSSVTQPHFEVSNPDPDLDGTEPALKNPDPEKTPEKKKRRTEKKRGGSARGGQADLLGTERPPTVEPFVQEVVGHLNEVCGTAFPPSDQSIRSRIAKLMASGYTIEDMKLVNIWANKRWPGGTKDLNYWRETFLVPSKLYGEKFGEHLGLATRQDAEDDDGEIVPRDQMFGTPEFNARMGYDKEPSRD